MKLLFAGKSLKDITYFKPHEHSAWEIVVISKGEGIVETKSEKLDFRFGTAYVMPPNTRHKGHSSTPFCDIALRIDELDFPKDKITAVTLNDEFYIIATQIVNLYQKQHDDYKRTLNSLTESLVYLIMDSIGEQNKYLFTANIRDFLADNISNENITMNEIASFSGYDTDYIRRAFKKDYSKTPLEYLTMLRINYAKKLLENMEYYRISDIAELCGFSDALYFSKCFKKNTGISPKEYRQKSI